MSPMIRRQSGSVSRTLTRLRKCEYRSDSRDGRSMERSIQLCVFNFFDPDLAYHAFLSSRGKLLTTVYARTVIGTGEAIT